MNILVLGAGVSGVAAARSAIARGHFIRFHDDRTDVVLPRDLAGCQVHGGGWNPSLLDGVDEVIASPGFPPASPSVKAVRAAGVPIIAEAQFGLDHMQTSIVAVTGTNGKSTVTQTAADMLRASGKNAVAAGNIGTPMSELAENGVEYDVVVAELSSFQLDMMDIHPTAATILNIAPDHLDWHGSFDAYVAAKASVLDQMVDDDVFVSNADDDLVTSIAASAKCRVVAVSGFRVPPDGNGVDGQTIVIGSDRYPAPIEDPSYRFDLVVAATLASVVGATPDGIGKIIAAFEPGQHRRNLVAVVDGVRWINDSKGTNPHATVAAASAYDRVRLLVGGRNKDLDLSPISRIENLAGLYAFGEAGPDIAKDAVGAVTVHASMEDAMRAAANDAQPGDVVLLSPGCTSFDEFTSYAERGARFAQIVHTMEGGSGR
jgi:UDP-N-acetylmuramoylalanine--D-glutamate ligase